MIEKEVFLEKINKFKAGFDFSKINKNGSKTQDRAGTTEDYVREFIEDLISDDIDNYIVAQAGSQQPYDFIVIKKENMNNWSEPFKTELLKKYELDGKIHALIKKKFKGLEKEVRDQILRIEVKAGQKKFVANDTLPDPEDPVIYFFFEWDSNKLFVVSSVEMAKAEGEEKYNYILKKYVEDLLQVSEWRKEKIKQWDGIEIFSAPRINYSFSSKYAYTKQDADEFSRLYDVFKKAL